MKHVINFVILVGVVVVVLGGGFYISIAIAESPNPKESNIQNLEKMIPILDEMIKDIKIKERKESDPKQQMIRLEQVRVLEDFKDFINLVLHNQDSDKYKVSETIRFFTSIYDVELTSLKSEDFLLDNMKDRILLRLDK